MTLRNHMTPSVPSIPTLRWIQWKNQERGIWQLMWTLHTWDTFLAQIKSKMSDIYPPPPLVSAPLPLLRLLAYYTLSSRASYPASYVLSKYLFLLSDICILIFFMFKWSPCKNVWIGGPRWLLNANENLSTFTRCNVIGIEWRESETDLHLFSVYHKSTAYGIQVQSVSCAVSVFTRASGFYDWKWWWMNWS